MTSRPTPSSLCLPMSDAEIQKLSSGIAIWHRYDAMVKADLFSTALRTDSGTYLIDPISVAPAVLEPLLSSNKVAGLIATNANHSRSTLNFSQRLAVPVFAHRDAAKAL